MCEAMKNAIVGDDALRDDPTVLELEELGARLLGKEAALFTISGTMSNEIAVMTYLRPGDEIIVYRDSHIYNLENGALAALSGVQARVVEDNDGIHDSEILSRLIYQESIQRAPTRLICLENTFHLDQGLALRREDLAATIAIANQKRIPLVMDGARQG